MRRGRSYAPRWSCWAGLISVTASRAGCRAHMDGLKAWCSMQHRIARAAAVHKTWTAQGHEETAVPASDCPVQGTWHARTQRCCQACSSGAPCHSRSEAKTHPKYSVRCQGSKAAKLQGSNNSEGAARSDMVLLSGTPIGRPLTCKRRVYSTWLLAVGEQSEGQAPCSQHKHRLTW